MSNVALRLFEERGFERVTMTEIAEAASVSRRTLFRLFPSKSDLVWNGAETVRDVVQRRAAPLGDRLTLDALVEQLVVPILRALDAPEAASLARRRLRLIGAAPTLIQHASLREIEAVIAEMLPARSPHGVPASLTARTLTATTFAALLWWAEQGGEMSALDAARHAWSATAPAGSAGA